MLAAFSLGAYGGPCESLHPGFDVCPNQDLSLPNPSSPSGTNADFSGAAYAPGTDTYFIVNNDSEEIFEYSRAGQFLRTVHLSGFDDTEGIVHLTGNRFAVVEEKGYDHDNNPLTAEQFHLSIFTMPSYSTNGTPKP